MKIPIEFAYWGKILWSEADKRMSFLRDQRVRDIIADQIIFLEHTPVITMGRQPSWDDLKITPTQLLQKGVICSSSDRGGKLTAHEPGQLVIYFIVDIRKRSLSVVKWVSLVEEVIIQLLQTHGIFATVEKGNPGLWLGLEKIASVGFHIHKGVTTHGVSLNVNNDLKIFDYFIPCGLPDRRVTSMKKLLGYEVDMEKIIHQLQDIFRAELT